MVFVLSFWMCVQSWMVSLFSLYGGDFFGVQTSDFWCTKPLSQGLRKTRWQAKLLPWHLISKCEVMLH